MYPACTNVSVFSCWLLAGGYGDVLDKFGSNWNENGQLVFYPAGDEPYYNGFVVSGDRVY